jgi:DNA-binding NtrC family response regulator
VVRRVGSVRDRRIDCWIVGATNKDLASMLSAGSFRKDLYYRLAVVTIRLPPLRERAEDIGLLSEFFLKRFRAKYGRPELRLGDAALETLGQHDWPGNVRELRHVLERAVLASPAGATELRPEALGTSPARISAEPAADGLGGALPPEGTRLADWERAMIARALSEAGGNQTKAARLLGVSRDTLRYRMTKFKITEP